MSELVSPARMPRILVMMGTCNGERYLSEQVDSILGQRGVRVVLRACDDRSDDGTYGVLRDYACNHPNVQVSQNRRRLGVGLNFMQMVYEASPEEYDFYAFSDQDDVWLPNKLVVAAAAIEKAEGRDHKELPGIGAPVLYCSDLLNVDEHLENPLRELPRLSPIGERGASPLVRNRYSGCTMVFNRACVRLVQRHPIDWFGRNHDAWLFLLAYYCGNVVVDRDSALIMRRITGRNTEGALVPGRDVRRASVRRVVTAPDRKASKSARLLLENYGPYMSEEDRVLVRSFCTYTNTIFGRIKWAVSRSYKSLSPIDTLLVRVKFLLGRM